MNDRHLDGGALFEALYPGFFRKPEIRGLPEDGEWEEMALWLGDFSPHTVEIPVPGGVAFGYWNGDLETLRGEVNRVDDGWPELYTEDARVYCAFDGDRPVSFCILDEMGVYDGLRVAGPGCVGTLPEYRRRGIGLKMVQNVTAILKEDGCDLSYIHYTGVGPWYAKLGYRTTARWNREGIVAR